MGLIDTHLHLDAAEYAADRESVIARARAAGVHDWVVPGVTAALFPAVRRLADQEAGVHPAFGIHPLYVDQAREADLDVLRASLQAPDVVAVGEIGLDGYHDPVDIERQLPWFIAQLRLAHELQLPVLLHVRRAVDVVLRELRRCRVPGGIAHAFNGSRQQAEAFISLGFRLGMGGAMTYAGSRRIRELAATLPLDSIVLETDGPDIPPAWCGEWASTHGTPPGRSEPAMLWRYAQLLAELRSAAGQPCSPADIIVATRRNACAVLPRLQVRSEHASDG